MDYSVFVDDEQSALVKENEGVELEETDVSPRLRNAGCIEDDDGDKAVREPDPRAELTTSVADDHNLEGVGRQTADHEWTVQCLPGSDSSVCSGP